MQEQEINTLNELLKNHPYKPISKISYGSFGEIFKLTSKQGQDEYALKVTSKERMAKQKKLHQSIIEGYILHKVNHPGIVKYFDTIQNKKYICQLLEFCPYGDFFELMKKVNKNMELVHKKKQILKFYLAQIVQALSYLHSLQIVHRDIKPENIVIGTDFHIRIVDFGTAKTLKPELMYNEKQMQFLQQLKFIKVDEEKQEEEILRQGSLVGSANYLSPQSIGMKHCLASDIWSLGVIIYKFFHSRLPFEGENNFLIFSKIRKIDYQVDQQLSNEIKDLIHACLKADPDERITIQNIKKHPYFSSINFEILFKSKPPMTQKDLRMTQVKISPIKHYKLEVVLEKQMFFGNYKPRVLKMYNRDKKLYMSYWYLEKNVPKNEFEIRINDYAEKISKTQFIVKNDDVKYTFRLVEKFKAEEIVEQINSIIRQFYKLE